MSSEYIKGIIDCIGFILVGIFAIAIAVIIVEAIKEKLKKVKNEKLWVQQNISSLHQELIKLNNINVTNQNDILALELELKDLKKKIGNKK